MKDAALVALLKTVGASPVLAAGIGAITLIGGALWHASVQLNDQGELIKQQGIQISALSDKSDARDVQIAGISIGIAQVQGQIATIHQELVDQEKFDRAERHSGH